LYKHILVIHIIDIFFLVVHQIVGEKRLTKLLL